MKVKNPQGSRIPTESEIVETWEVARTTARRAIALLRDQGLVITVPQRGSYVQSSRALLCVFRYEHGRRSRRIQDIGQCPGRNCPAMFTMTRRCS